jgi:hypothetical protein
MVIVHMVLLTHSVAPARNSFLAPIVQEFIFIFVHMVRLWLPPRFSVPASSTPIGQIFLLVAQVFLQLPVLGSLLRSNNYVVLVELEERCVESDLGHRLSSLEEF